MPAAKSINRLPSTSSITAPSAFAAKIGVTWNGPRATAAWRLAINTWLLGPGTLVLRTIVMLPSGRVSYVCSLSFFRPQQIGNLRYSRLGNLRYLVRRGFLCVLHVSAMFLDVSTTLSALHRC